MHTRPAVFATAAASRLRGGARVRMSKASAAEAVAPSQPPPERALQPVAFIFVLSVAVVALAPAQFLVARCGQARAAGMLAAIGSLSAVAEILLAPLVGALSDSIGRKPVLVLTLASVLVVNSATAVVPLVPVVIASTFVSKLVVGLFFLSSGAALGDAYRTNPAALATGLASVGVRETMPQSERVPFTLKKGFNPVSCVRLLRNGREMRLLALLLAITLQPIFMGDTLQLYALGEWKLDTKQVATLFTAVPVLGALGNVVGGRLVKSLGVQAFTALATASNMIFWAGCCVSYPAALTAATIGFLGPARTLGASTALTTLGASKGIPQGQLSGDRSNLIAILKVLGPTVYGGLYVNGKAAGVPALPFMLNLALTFSALLLAPAALASVSGEAGGAEPKKKA